MSYKIINNKLTTTQETGTVQEVDTTYTDAKEQVIPIKVQVPIITFEEVSPDPISQVVENMLFDYNNAVAEMNSAIAKVNELSAKMQLIKDDIPEIGLPDAKVESLAVVEEAPAEEVAPVKEVIK